MICLKQAKMAKKAFQEKYLGRFIRIDISKNEIDEYVLDCHLSNPDFDMPCEYGGIKIRYCYD